MQNEIVITLSLYVLGAALLGYSLFRAITTAHRRGFNAGTALAAKVHEPLMQAQQRATTAAWCRLDMMSEELERDRLLIAQLQTDQAMAVTVSPQDIGLMIQVANTVELAERTWAPIKGASPMARKARTLHGKLEALNSRLTAAATQAAREAA
ncbi:hypothetical protein NRB16_04010 [Pseudomonas sp. LJDD11]|uniref:hypothetical protein n=1 Tax=Pseudomonas sp. LJDD11 TaxID=2931984 RepID=UPI00211C9969|nr:hypothetical protein [Pseudomonas sp. LJDD11]MCQ9422696.1 hypothetical protein [Pseudomonas sp. LJDD11]